MDKKERISNEKKEFQRVKSEALSKNDYEDLKSNLPEIIRNKKRELVLKMEEYMLDNDVKTVPYSRIYEMMSSGNIYNRTKYSSEELAIAFEVFKSITADISAKNYKHTPTKQNFCAFIGISTVTFDNYRTSEDLELVEVVNRIDDYLTDVQLTLAQNNILNPTVTLFRTKVEHNYIEPTEVIRQVADTNTDRQGIEERLRNLTGKEIIDVDVKEKD